MRHLTLAGDLHDLQRITAVMVFPEDELFRNSYLRMLIDRNVMPEDGTIPTYPAGEMPRWTEMRDLAEKSVRSGWLAGDLLAIYAAMTAYGFREPSSRKAA